MKYSRPKVSVLVPVYQVAAYVEQCARALFEQTLQDLEYVFVDDGSPDDSISVLLSVLEDYPNRKNQVHILKHPKNLSLGTARKTAVEAATGEYIIHCDSDDRVEKTMCEIMYNKAIETNADLVSCDYILHKRGNERYMSCSYNGNAKDCMYRILGIQYSPNLQVWNKLVRTDIVKREDFIFPVGINLSEDHIQTLQYFYYANSMCHIPQPLVHYYYHANSLSHTIECTKRQADDILSINELCFSFINSHISDFSDVSKMINNRKFQTKIFMLSSYDSKGRRTNMIYPETDIPWFEKPYMIRAKLGLWGLEHKMSWLFDFYLWQNKLLRKIGVK